MLLFVDNQKSKKHLKINYYNKQKCFQLVRKQKEKKEINIEIKIGGPSLSASLEESSRSSGRESWVLYSHLDTMWQWELELRVLYCFKEEKKERN